jgi:hypothetical protein
VSRRARSASGAFAAAASLLALASAWHSGGHVLGLLRAGYATYAPLCETQRRQAPTAGFEIPGSIFDFFAAHIVPGDRVYYQVLPSGLSSNVTLPEAVAAIGNFYLLPGVETTDLADATVVVSWFEDPGLLHVRFLTQVQAGAQPLFVSRIRVP